jgi:phage FluMu gp28-like protein
MFLLCFLAIVRKQKHSFFDEVTAMHLRDLPTSTRLIVMCFVLAFLPVAVLALTIVSVVAAMNHLGGG